MSKGFVHHKLRRDEISLGGCGLMGMYYVGVAHCMEEDERARHFRSQIKTFYGSSAGAIACVLTVCECGWAQGYKLLRRIWESANKNPLLGRLGVLRPSFKLYKIVREFLEEVLPRDAHRRCRGRVKISLTVLPEMRNWLVSDFNTRAELINAVVASSYMPLVFGGIQPSVFRGKMCCDGGFSSNIPFQEDPHIITISPFAGGCDICPQGEPGPIFFAKDQPWQMSRENMERLIRVVFPAKWEDMETIFNQGFNDASRFIKKEGHLYSDNEQTVTVTEQLSPATSSPELEEEVATSDYFSMSPSHSRQPSATVALNEIMPEEAYLPLRLPVLRACDKQVELLKSTEPSSWVESMGITWRRLMRLMQLSNSKQVLALYKSSRPVAIEETTEDITSSFSHSQPETLP